jgi:hypothetical protein
MEILFNTAHAQNNSNPVVPTVPDNTLQGFPTLGTWVTDNFPLFIKLIAAIAVLTIAYWGLRYILSGIPGIQSYGKERMWSAILGLILALAAYMILEIINPDILNSVNSFLSS